MEGKNKGKLSNVWFFLGYMFQMNKILFVWKLLNMLLNIVNPFIPIVFVRCILNEITIGRDAGHLAAYVLGMAGAVFFSSFLRNIFGRFVEEQTDCAVKKMQNHLGEAVMYMEYGTAERPETRNFIQSVQENVSIAGVLSYVETVITSSAVICGLFGLILTVQPALLFFTALVVGARTVADRKNIKLYDDWDPVFSERFRKIGYFSRVMKELGFGKEVRNNNLQNWIYHKADDVTDQYVKEATALNVDIQKNDAMAAIAMVLQEGAVYLILAYKVVFRGMSIGDYSMFMTSVNTFAGNVESLVYVVSELRKNGLFLRNFRKCMEMAKRVEDAGGAVPDMEDFTVEFRHVSFRYPNTERMILEDISLIMRKGESLSIVGLNGAGKTTFVKLLCRLYRPISGQIFLNGVDIWTISYWEYVKLIGVLFQDFKLFAFSIRENITLGQEQAGDCMVQDAYVEECVKQSGLWERVRDLPKGLETSVTKEFDSEGTELSGGQAQKLAMARLLYKNPPVVVLDEPTAALDPLAEHEIYESFHGLVRNKLSIFISHRLSSCQFCDRVVVFEEGKIAQYGTHKELRAREGLYNRMWNMQARYYVEQD